MKITCRFIKAESGPNAGLVCFREVPTHVWHNPGECCPRSLQPARRMTAGVGRRLLFGGRRDAS